MADLVSTGDGPADVDPDGEASRVEIEQTSDGAGTVVLTVAGELDLGSEASLRETAEKAVGGGAKTVVFELSGLTFMDSSGIGLLLTIAAQVAEVEVRNPSTIVRRVIELSGLATTLRMTP
jgi:anti-anti-sigma factor